MTTRRRFLMSAAALAVLARARRGEAANAAARTSQFLTAMARLMYPHDSLPESMYLNVAASIDVSAVAAGMAELDAAAGGDWLALAAADRLRLLKARETTPFFQAVRVKTMLGIYTDRTVWSRFGYGGDAWSFGGYGGNAGDLDWLPEPKVPA